jgi:uncharacterized protein (DUF58 family)
LWVTREGWYWLLACIALCLTGLARGINLLTLLGCLMAVVWILHVFSSLRRLRGLTGRRSLEEPIFARTPFSWSVEIANPPPTPRSPRLGLLVEDKGATPKAGWRIPVLAPGGTARFQDQLSCRRRGHSSLGPLVVSSRLPFGLVARRRVLLPREEFIVLPRLGRLHRGRLRRFLTRTAFTAGQTRHLLRRDPAAQEDLHGLRSFRSGDSPRWIHWRTTARMGELMVREMEDMATDNLVLVLDPALRPGEKKDLLEQAVSLAATICWEWCRQTGDRMALAVAGSPPVVVSGVTGRDLALRMLRALAVQPGVAEPDGEALREALSRARVPPGPVLVVGTGPTSLGEIVGKTLNRPVVCVDLTAAGGADFFEF